MRYTVTIETEEESPGKWIADIQIIGDWGNSLQVYGDTEKKAVRAAVEIMLEVFEATP